MKLTVGGHIPAELTERNREMFGLWKQGKTFAELGHVYDVSPSRAAAICQMLNRRRKYRSVQAAQGQVPA